jgi:hypothetical protein
MGASDSLVDAVAVLTPAAPARSGSAPALETLDDCNCLHFEEQIGIGETNYD